MKGPTPAFVRSARRSGDLMVAVAAGASTEEIADQFGFGSARDLDRELSKDRDRLRPPDRRGALEREIGDTSKLLDFITSNQSPTGPRLTHPTRRDPVGALLDHQLRLLAVRDAASSAGDLPVGEATRVGEPVWTDAVAMRADGESFDAIAAAFGLAEPGAAIAVVVDELDAYRCAAVTALRDAQLSDLDDRVEASLRMVEEAASPVAGEVVAAAVTALVERSQVRGVFVAPPIDRPRSSPRRWSDPSARVCCGGGSVRVRDVARALADRRAGKVSR